MQDNRSLSEPTGDECYNLYEQNHTNYYFETHSLEYTTREFEYFNRVMIEFKIKQAEAEAAAAAALKLAEAAAAAALKKNK